MAIEVHGLTKTYRTVRAVDDLSFSVDDGILFAFLGGNGAGKSTTINCLTTVLPFDAGHVRIAGHDVARDGGAARQSMGVVFQESILDSALTVEENLRLRATLAGLDRTRAASRIRELSDLVSLGSFFTRQYGLLSGGQKRRVDIARALLHEPSIIFLDEPTAGLDPGSRAIVWDTMRDLRQNTGLTVFLTTHYMEETEDADRVCIIDKGRIIADATPTALRAQHSSSTLTITTKNPARLTIEADAQGANLTHDNGLAVITVPDASTARAILTAHGDEVVDFEFRHGRMDDVFLALTGRTTEGNTTVETAE